MSASNRLPLPSAPDTNTWKPSFQVTDLPFGLNAAPAVCSESTGPRNALVAKTETRAFRLTVPDFEQKTCFRSSARPATTQPDTLARLMIFPLGVRATVTVRPGP